MSPANQVAFGSWPSPLSAGLVASGSVHLSGPLQRGGDIFWSELRPVEAGRSVLVRRAAGAEPVDLLPAPWSARTLVHEYGGGAWWLGASALYFAHWNDQRLYRFDPVAGESQPEGGVEPVALTPEPPTPRAWRYADGREHPTQAFVVCVRERHGAGAEATNELVAIATELSPGKPLGEPVILGATTDGLAQADFVAAPRFSADGRWLSWIRWNHPRMPWDGTELCVAPVFAGMRLGNIQVVAGGETEAVHGADWTADGRLVFSTDRSGFWNLHSWSPGSSSDQALTQLTGAEIGAPQWVFGTQRWAELTDGRLAAVVTDSATDHLVVVGTDGSIASIPTPYLAIGELSTTDHNTILINGATPVSLPDLVELDLAGIAVAWPRPADGVSIEAGWFSVAQPVTYHLEGRLDSRDTHAFVYPPTGPGFEGLPGERPPLVVMGHGGPTAHASRALNLRVQYWTSRGFAVADVNYGGSSGFGRAYRQLLAGAWGVVDVEDCIAVAARLADSGMVDAERLAIRGGSAGGFTVLSTLVQSDTFSAGTSLYGVADLEALARDTHKFESRYLDGLIGPYPERIDLYQDRSPINHTDQLSCPLLVLQGLEDEIVPPNQSEAIVAALAAKGIPHAYVTFEGEQHGFRQEANIIRSFEVELWFYGRVFGFEPADPIAPAGDAVGL